MKKILVVFLGLVAIGVLIYSIVGCGSATTATTTTTTITVATTTTTTPTTTTTSTTITTTTTTATTSTTTTTTTTSTTTTTAARPTWVAVQSGTSNDLMGVDFISGSQGWVVGANATIRKTVDGGGTWESEASGISDHMRAVFIASSSGGLAAGDNGKIAGYNGLGWGYMQTDTTERLLAVQLIATNAAYAVGDNGAFLTLDVGGTSWSTQDVFTSTKLRDVYFNDPENGYVVGSGGQIWKYKNSNWASEESSTTENLRTISVADSKIFVAGDAGTIRERDPNGDWQVVPFPDQQATIYDLQFIDDSVGFAACDQGSVYATTNGGTDWYPMTMTPTASVDFYSLDIQSINSGCVVGQNGTIYVIQ